MKYKKVLLICPRFCKGRNRLTHFPLAGLGYIAEALQKAGIAVNVLDMNLGYNLHDLENRINEFNPDIIGFTGMTLGHKDYYDAINHIKNLYPQLKIAIGGSHLSSVREKVLEDCQGIDFGIVLEGDISLVQLCNGEELDKIQGLIYRKDGKIITNKFEHFIDNLDQLGFPKYEAFELDKYPIKQIGIATSRGCPYDCIYCSVIASIGKKFRPRSAQAIVEEISYWYSRGYKEIFILDDNFTLLRKRVEEICALLAKNDFTGVHLKCPNGIRADRVDYELLKKMKEAGFDMVAFGVEAGTDNILKNIKKGENIATIEKSIKQACDLGFDVDLFFLIGSPGETIEDVKESFALASRYPVRRAIFYNLIPLPATELLDWLNQKNYLTDSPEYILNNASYYLHNPCFFTPEMSIEQRKKALKMGFDVSARVRRRFIERKIKGPFLLRRMVSRIYIFPIVEDLVNNNRIILKGKEIVKRIMMKK